MIALHQLPPNSGRMPQALLFERCDVFKKTMDTPPEQHLTVQTVSLTIRVKLSKLYNSTSSSWEKGGELTKRLVLVSGFRFGNFLAAEATHEHIYRGKVSPLRKGNKGL